MQKNESTNSLFYVYHEQCDQMKEQKLCKKFPRGGQKGATDIYYFKLILSKQPKKLPKIWATLKEKRTFKNRPIWSHCHETQFSVVHDNELIIKAGNST